MGVVMYRRGSAGCARRFRLGRGTALGMQGLCIAAVLLGFCQSPATAQAPPSGHRIAVMPLKNLKPDPETDWIGQGAAEALSTRLVSVPGLRTIERLQIEKVREEQNFQNTDLADPATAVAIGKLLGAERIVVGSFVKAGPNILFNVRVVDVATGEVLSTGSLQAAEAQIFDALSQLADTIIRSFDKKAVLVDNRTVVAPASDNERIVLTPDQLQKLKEWGTTNVEAYKAYVKGVYAKDPDEQIRWLSTAIALDKGYTLAYNMRGSLHHHRGEADKAIADFTRAIECNPNSVRDYVNRGAAYFHKKDLDRAWADFTKAISLDPRNEEARFNRARAEAERGNPDAAIADYNRALEIVQHNASIHTREYAASMSAQVYTSRGCAYADKKEYGQAVADHCKAIELEPRKAIAYNNRGQAYDKMGDRERALADYGKAVELDPHYARAYNNRALMVGKIGETDAAIADYTRAIQADPAFSSAYQNRGTAYVKKKEYAKAIADFDKAVELAPANAVGWYSRGYVYAETKQYERALTDFDKAIELDPRFPKTYNNRARLYAAIGERDKALADWARALEINPNYANALASRGMALADWGDYDKALQDCGKAIELDPKDAAGYEGRARAHLERKEYAKAWADVKTCRELGGTPDEQFLQRLRTASGRAE